MSTVLNLHNVNVVRGGRNILRDVSWSVNEGERWVVLGPNGAGKSTTMRMIMGLDKPTSGKVTVNGHPYRDLPAVAVANPIYPEHDAAYLRECLDNLASKGIHLYTTTHQPPGAHP